MHISLNPNGRKKCITTDGSAHRVDIKRYKYRVKESKWWRTVHFKSLSSASNCILIITGFHSNYDDDKISTEKWHTQKMLDKNNSNKRCLEHRIIFGLFTGWPTVGWYKAYFDFFFGRRWHFRFCFSFLVSWTKTSWKCFVRFVIWAFQGQQITTRWCNVHFNYVIDLPVGRQTKYELIVIVNIDGKRFSSTVENKILSLEQKWCKHVGTLWSPFFSILLCRRIRYRMMQE